MSVKMALAKLSVTAVGGALLAGGAVHVAEKQITDTPSYKSDKIQPVRYIKESPKIVRRAVPEERRKRRVVEREVECVPAGPAAPAHALPAPAYDEECPPAYQVAMVPVPLPPAPPISGGSSGGVTAIGGSGGFGGVGGGIVGGLFGGGGSSGGNG